MIARGSNRAHGSIAYCPHNRPWDSIDRKLSYAATMYVSIWILVSIVMNPTAKAGGLSLALHSQARMHPRR